MTLRFKNAEINALQRRTDILLKEQKNVSDELQKLFGRKMFNGTMNNIWLIEIQKVVKKLSKKYGFNYQEGLQHVAKVKVVEDEEENEEEKSQINEDVFTQLLVDGKKYYSKNKEIYDDNLKKVGSFVNNKPELY